MNAPTDTRLPHFERPPVSQVLLSVAFEPLPRLRGTHLGIFWNSLNESESFPIVEEFPYEPALLEPFEDEDPIESDGLEVSLVGRASPPRVVFSNIDGTRHIAVQKDLLQVGWTKLSENEYERYETSRSLFLQTLEKFEKFIISYQLGSLRLLQGEVSYTNEIGVELGAPVSGVEELIQFRAIGSKPLPPLEDFHFFQEHSLSKDGKVWGKLYVSLLSNNDTAESQAPYDSVDLEISVQGPIESGDALAFLDKGHDAVVQTFVEVTTSHAHDVWGRLGRDS